MAMIEDCLNSSTRSTKQLIQAEIDLASASERISPQLSGKDGIKVYGNDRFNIKFDDNTNPDITAMSVLSLYEKDDSIEHDMDTEKDIKKVPNCGSEEMNLSEENPMLNSCDMRCCRHNTTTLKCDCNKTSIYFRDGKRTVNFVLVWDSFSEAAMTEQAVERRKVFEKNLKEDGLELEYETVESSGLNFIKIHTPREVLKRYSEILKLRMPMKELPTLRRMRAGTNYVLNRLNIQWEKFKTGILVDRTKFPEKGHRFTAVYSRDKEYLFDVDHPCFYTPAIHSRIVQFILDRKRFSQYNEDDFAFGIERLIEEKVYSAAYPLHDGDIRRPGSMRHLLYNEWAAVNKFYRYQPLDYIREYFGVKIALYFAWLGFYTHMLLFASIVGLACFIYSCATLYTNVPSEDICTKDLDIKMCPACDYWCDYSDIKETCLHSRVTYLFDNPSTVFFAIFMSFWATLFLEMWKRYSAEITHRWDLTGFDVQEEHPRPKYLARLAHVKRLHVNIITNTMEPQVPFWRLKLPVTILSFSVVILLIVLALAAVLGVMLYRISTLASLAFYRDSVLTSNAILFTTVTAASINLCCIFVFNWIYTWVAEYLTELELLRTQTEFDDSLTLKIYLLQFVNYYASIFYIAFFKGKFIGYPGEYNTFFQFRQEECGPGGCLLELCIQLAIIMVGKQAMNTGLEMLLPLVYKWMNTMKIKAGIKNGQFSTKNAAQWIRDFKLVEWGPRGLFPEYLEMVLQYGFVTIFVAAFPLAPFFALLNNILEMRLDAKKLLTYYRRPVTQRVRDIGVWYRILDSIGKLSVVTNGLIIAFTSEFIPKIVYQLTISENHSLEGYLNDSLSYFNTNEMKVKPRFVSVNVTHCRYPDYREHPDSENRYQLTTMFWKVLAARLAFVVIFENIVVIVMILVRWCIPDMPSELRDRIRREAYITNEIIIKQETLRAQEEVGAAYASPRTRMNIADCPTTQEQWDRLMNKSLSGSDFDLMVHSNSAPSQDTIDRPPSSKELDSQTPTSV